MSSRSPSLPCREFNIFPRDHEHPLRRTEPSRLLRLKSGRNSPWAATGSRRLWARFAASTDLLGAVILSTCNRVEFYAASLCPVRAFDSLQTLLRNRTGVEAPLYFHDTPRSVRHLFRVASGLDSMVLGGNGDSRPGQESLFDSGRARRDKPPPQQIVPARLPGGQDVRTDTQITRGATSVGAVAVELAGKIFVDLSGRRVMILGAGETSERTARSLAFPAASKR